MLAASTRSVHVVLRRTSAYPLTRIAPARAGIHGVVPLASANSTTRTTATGNNGTAYASPVGGSYVSRSSARNHQRSTAYSAATATSHTGSIAQVNPTNVSPVAPNTSRLVRLETGSRVDPELAIRTEAYACERCGLTPVAAIRMGVSSTTVASRLSTAVTAAARPMLQASSRVLEPAASRDMCPPRTSNRPSSAQACASTMIETRNATVSVSEARS